MGHASTSDICVPDTWLRRQLHALASASKVQGPLVVFCSVARLRNQFQERRPLSSAPFWSAAVIVLLGCTQLGQQSFCVSSVCRHFVIRCVK